MFDISCTRCTATGTGNTRTDAEFGLKHDKGCGMRIAVTKIIPSGKKPTLKDLEPVIGNTDDSEILFSNEIPKKKIRKKSKIN